MFIVSFFYLKLFGDWNMLGRIPH